MKVKYMIDALGRFDGDMEVTISDGYEGVFYAGNDFNDYQIAEFEGSVDISIGGCKEEICLS